MAFALWLFQMFLAHVIFRDRDYPNITVSIDNRYTSSHQTEFVIVVVVVVAVVMTKRIMHGRYQRHKFHYTLYSLFAIYHSNDEKLHHPNELHEILISRDLR